MPKSVTEKIEQGYYDTADLGSFNIDKECQKCSTIFKRNNNYCISCGSSLRWYQELYNEHIDKKKEREQGMKTNLKFFKKEALEECGILKHPKADKCYNMAWDNRHSEGLYAVFQELSELSELLN